MVMLYPTEERINILAPAVRGRKGEFKKELLQLRQRGFTRVRSTANLSLDDEIKLDRRRNHTIDVVVDRPSQVGIRAPACRVDRDRPEPRRRHRGDQYVRRRRSALPGGWRTQCGISMPEMTPRAFSFNSPHGACPECQGLGAVYDFDPSRIVPDEGLLGRSDRSLDAGRQEADPRRAVALGRNFGIDLDIPFCKLPKTTRRVKRSGWYRQPRVGAAKDPFGAGFEGVIRIAPRYGRRLRLEQEALEPYRSLRPRGLRRRTAQTETRAVRVKQRTISDYVNPPISDALGVFDALELNERENAHRRPDPARDSRSSQVP